MGDGINDAAALRQSNIGISVDSAVDIAKESADIILLEKDLMVLEQGVLSGRDNVFRVCPKDDGVFGIAQVEYQHNKSNYYLGNSVYHNSGTSATPWFYTEQGICNNLTLIAGYSHAFGDNIFCHDFVGVGAHYQSDKYSLGVLSDYARFSECNEWATELTCKYTINDHIQIQPIAHLILTDNQFNSAFSLRLNIAY